MFVRRLLTRARALIKTFVMLEEPGRLNLHTRIQPKCRFQGFMKNSQQDYRLLLLFLNLFQDS